MSARKQSVFWSSTQLTFPVYLLTAPYARFGAAVDGDLLRDGDLPRGTLVGVRAHPEHSWALVAAMISELNRRLSTVAVILWTDRLALDRAVTLAARARAAGARAVVPEAIPNVSHIRDQLTDTVDFPIHLIRWLRDRGWKLTPHVAELVAKLGQSGLQYPDFVHLRKASGIGESTWQRAFRRARLGHPAAWFQVVRWVLAGVVTQRQSDVSIVTIARGLGYTKPAAFRNRCQKVIGATPSEMQANLGWEWMLHSGLSRRGLIARRRDVQ